MCGIAGLVDLAGGEVPIRLLRQMLDGMAHRGPDDEAEFDAGRVAIGMRRLSILDVEKGSQPFFDDSGEIAAVMNGEIYNFRDLRRELESKGVSFRTECDAEVIPHAYRHFGLEGMLGKIDGMFSIAILDRQKRCLYLARDRFGEKPLFYWEGAKFFAFSSQLSCLANLPGFDRRIDPSALRQYLAMHFITGPRTIWSEAKRVPPGWALELELGGRSSARTFPWLEVSVPEESRKARDEAEVIQDTRDLLDRAVGSRCISDVPIGVFLSGGVDSSAVAAAVAAFKGSVNTFSIGFEDADLDESVHAARVAKHIGANHHHFRFDLDACLRHMDAAIVAAGEPLGDPASLPVFLLAREARSTVKVVLSGEGADEVFGGYGYYPRDPAPPPPRRWLQRLSFRRLSGRAGRRAPALMNSFFRPDFTTPSGFPLLTSPEQRDALVLGGSEVGDEDPWLSGVAARSAGSRCDLRAAQWADMETWLPDDLLPKFDRMTMAASVEGRAPFLEPSLVQFGLSLPRRYKQGDGGESKWALRRSVADTLPPGIADRPKQGFVLPMQDWFVGPLRERILDELDGDRNDGLDHRQARALVERDLSEGANRARLLYALLAYRIWIGAL